MPNEPHVHLSVDALTINVNHTMSADDTLKALFHSLNQKVDHIMATQAEVLQQLNDTKAALDVIGAEVDKVGTETDGLVKAVADLTAAAGNVQTTPEFDAALAAVVASKDALAARVKTVDDKVADAVAA